MNRSMLWPSGPQERNVTETCQEIRIYYGLSESDNEWYECFYIPLMESKPGQNGEENPKVKWSLKLFLGLHSLNRKQNTLNIFVVSMQWSGKTWESVALLQELTVDATKLVHFGKKLALTFTFQELVKEAEGAMCWLGLKATQHVHGGGLEDISILFSYFLKWDPLNWSRCFCFETTNQVMVHGIYQRFVQQWGRHLFMLGAYWVVVLCWKYIVFAQ